MTYLDVLESLGAAGFTIALIPQLIRTVRRERADDVDVSFLVLVLAASAVLLFYTIVTRQAYLAASYAANLLVWGTVLYYRLRPAATAKPTP